MTPGTGSDSSGDSRSDSENYLNMSEYYRTMEDSMLRKAIGLARKERRHRLAMSDISLYDDIVDGHSGVDDDSDAGRATDEADIFLFFLANPKGRLYNQFGAIQSGVLNLLYRGADDGPGSLMFDLRKEHPVFYGFYSEGKERLVSKVCDMLKRLSDRGLVERAGTAYREPVRYFMTPEQRERVCVS